MTAICGAPFAVCAGRRHHQADIWYVPSARAWLWIGGHHQWWTDCPWCSGDLPIPPSTDTLQRILAPEVWDEGEG